MKTKYLYFITFFFFVFVSAFSQDSNSFTYTIKGELIDSLSNEGEPYATIKITRKEKPDDVVRMAVTDVNGKFQEKITVIPDTYIITITSVGKSPVVEEVTLESQSKTLDLGTLYIKDASEMLAGVEIVAQKPLVKMDMDKIEYSVQDDPDAQSNNLLEMLRKVPLVTVDGEDKIQVNGSSSFKIHVNNKPNTLMSNNPTEVLKSIPANTIKYIEVITEPGAKYDAEGVGGILNIVTIGGGMQGYTATFNANINNYGAGAGAYATVQSGKFTVTGNYSYYLQDDPESREETYRNNYTNDLYKYSIVNGKNKYDGDYQYGNVEGSYEIDTLRLISFGMSTYLGNYDGKGNRQTVISDVDENFVYGFKSNPISEMSYGYVGANADYQRTFKKKGELLTFSYRLSTNPNKSKNNVYYYDIVDYPYDLPGLYSKNKAYTTEHTFQLDYTNPLNDKNEIETGAKYIIRNSKSESEYYDRPENNEEMVERTDGITKYDHLQDILAAYGGYRIKISKFSVKVGLRYEHTFMKIKYHAGKGSDFDKGFDDVVPSLNLSYKLAEMKTLGASYNMRISRPGIWYLNPYVNRTNPDEISYGNPDLVSEKSHNIGVRFSTISQKITWNVGLRHSFVNNSIDRYSWVGTDQETGRENVLHYSFRNMGKYNSTNFTNYFNWNIASTTRFYVNSTLNYSSYKVKDNDEVSNDGFRLNCSGGFQYTLPWKIRLSLNGGGSTPNVTSQGKRSGYYFYALGLNRQFINDRLTLSFYGNRLFDKERIYKNQVETENFYYSQKGIYKSRYVQFAVSYRIGELKASVKKAARSIQNDDVKSGEGNGGGSGQN